MLKLYCLIGLLTLGTLSNSADALSTDADQPINIAADQATIDDVKGIAIYEGNVIITQGTIQIDAKKVTLNYTQKQELDKVTAEGSPVTFKQTPDNSKEDIHARAKRMEYNANENMLHLNQEAELWQGKDSFAGHHISYNIKTGIIKADKGEQKEGRITVVIQPRKKSTSNDHKPSSK